MINPSLLDKILQLSSMHVFFNVVDGENYTEKFKFINQLEKKESKIKGMYSDLYNLFAYVFLLQTPVEIRRNMDIEDEEQMKEFALRQIHILEKMSEEGLKKFIENITNKIRSVYSRLLIERKKISDDIQRLFEENGINSTEYESYLKYKRPKKPDLLDEEPIMEGKFDFLLIKTEGIRETIKGKQRHVLESKHASFGTLLPREFPAQFYRDSNIFDSSSLMQTAMFVAEDGPYIEKYGFDNFLRTRRLRKPIKALNSLVDKILDPAVLDSIPYDRCLEWKVGFTSSGKTDIRFNIEKGLRKTTFVVLLMQVFLKLMRSKIDEYSHILNAESLEDIDLLDEIGQLSFQNFISLISQLFEKKEINDLFQLKKKIQINKDDIEFNELLEIIEEYVPDEFIKKYCSSLKSKNINIYLLNNDEDNKSFEIQNTNSMLRLSHKTVEDQILEIEFIKRYMTKAGETWIPEAKYIVNYNSGTNLSVIDDKVHPAYKFIESFVRNIIKSSNFWIDLKDELAINFEEKEVFITLIVSELLKIIKLYSGLKEENTSENKRDLLSFLINRYSFSEIYSSDFLLESKQDIDLVLSITGKEIKKKVYKLQSKRELIGYLSSISLEGKTKKRKVNIRGSNLKSPLRLNYAKKIDQQYKSEIIRDLLSTDVDIDIIDQELKMLFVKDLSFINNEMAIFDHYMEVISQCLGNVKIATVLKIIKKLGNNNINLIFKKFISVKNSKSYILYEEILNNLIKIINNEIDFFEKKIKTGRKQRDSFTGLKDLIVLVSLVKNWPVKHGTIVEEINKRFEDFRIKLIDYLSLMPFYQTPINILECDYANHIDEIYNKDGFDEKMKEFKKEELIELKKTLQLAKHFKILLLGIDKKTFKKKLYSYSLGILYDFDESSGDKLIDKVMLTKMLDNGVFDIYVNLIVHFFLRINDCIIKNEQVLSYILEFLCNFIKENPNLTKKYSRQIKNVLKYLQFPEVLLKRIYKKNKVEQLSKAYEDLIEEIIDSYEIIHQYTKEIITDSSSKTTFIKIDDFNKRIYNDLALFIRTLEQNSKNQEQNILHDFLKNCY